MGPCPLSLLPDLPARDPSPLSGELGAAGWEELQGKPNPAEENSRMELQSTGSSRVTFQNLGAGCHRLTIVRALSKKGM